MSEWDAFPTVSGGAQVDPWAAFPAAQGQNTSGQATPAADIGRGTAALVGVGQGLSANFADEIGGGVAAVNATRGINPTRGFAGMTADAVMGISQLVQEMVSGQRGPATEAYERTRDAMRQEAKTAREQYPGTVMAGEIAGSVVLPGGAAIQGATLPARMVRGAVVGGGYGGVAGAGEGTDLADRAKRGASGLAIGSVVGGAAAPVVGGLVRAGEAATAPVVRALRGASSPDAEAARRVVGAIERDIAADPAAVSRLTPREMIAARTEGQPVTLMDLGGETTRALARSAANTSPEGRGVLGRTIDDRFEGQAGRVTDWMRGAFHYPNADVQQQALRQASRTSNNQAYNRAYQEGAKGVWSPELERLASSRSVSDAMRRAAAAAGDESVVSGYGAMNPRITFTSDGRIQFNRSPNGMPTYPDLQYWDLVRRELSDAAQNAGERTAEGRRLGAFANALNAELDRIVPSYQQARQTAAHFFGARDALEAGQNFVMQNYANAEVRRVLSTMSPTERQLFQDGFVSRFIETLERTGDRRNILNQISANPQAREKLQIALGPQRANELEARLRIEGIMDLSRGAVQGNSTTARQLAEIGFAGGAGTVGAYGTYNLDPTQMTTAAIMGALLAGRRNIDQRVAGRVAEMLTSNDPRVLQRGIQIIARNERMMNALRSTDTRVARIGTQQGTPAAIQGPVTGRAEQEQQQPPRVVN